MDNTNRSNGTKFDLPELITSCLYASAISAMLSLSMSLNQAEISFVLIINTVLVIFLVFADWNNRIFVPLHFPKEDLKVQREPFFKSTKLISEIISMVLLVIFYSYLIKGNYGTDKIMNIYFLFALYLLACGVWNLLMVRIMNGINIKPLLTSLIRGNVFDIPDLKNYTKNFVERVKAEEIELKKILRNEVNDTDEDTDKSVEKYKKKKRYLLIKINIARTLAQFIGNHISWVNFWISFVLLVITFNGTKHFSFIKTNLDSLQCHSSFFLMKLILIGGLFLTLLIFISCIELNSVVKKTVYGIMMVVCLLIFYSFFSIKGFLNSSHSVSDGKDLNSFSSFSSSCCVINYLN